MARSLLILERVFARPNQISEAFLLFFRNGEDGDQAGYFRYIAVLDCDSNRAFGILATAEIVIDPDRILRPKGAVRETFGYHMVDAGSEKTVFDAVCFDTALQARFGL